MVYITIIDELAITISFLPVFGQPLELLKMRYTVSEKSKPNSASIFKFVVVAH